MLQHVNRCVAQLAPGNAEALRDLRVALHAIVPAPEFSGAVKTHVVQALLLLDDPRLSKGDGGQLLVKIKKLIEAAVAAHADGANAPRAAQPAAPSAAFSPDALLAPESDPSLVAEFIVEAREQLEIAEGALLLLDGDPADLEAVNTLFRAVHTIKGTSAFLGVEHATELAHHAETLLVAVRDGRATCSGELAGMLFRSVDMLDAMLAAIEGAAEGEIAMLPDGYRPLLGALTSPAALSCDERVDGVVNIRRSALGARRSAPDTRMVRVQAEELQQLAETVDDLLATHAMIARDTALKQSGNHDLARKIAHAEMVAQELKALSEAMHTAPLAPTFQRAARLVRDLAHQSGKTVQLVTAGGDIRLDRALLESLGDPLLHMLRNAVDHGIETPVEREQAGKPSAGTVHLTARQTPTHVVVDLADDGRGLDRQAILRKAIALGLVAADADLPYADVFAFIFSPGFSTADAVTALSGRGVGMDVVQRNVRSLGGSVEIASARGSGTTFTIRLPMRSSRASRADSPIAIDRSA